MSTHEKHIHGIQRNSIFESSIGTMTGMIGAIGGMGLMGLMIALGIVAAFCGCPLLFFLLLGLVGE